MHLQQGDAGGAASSGGGRGKSSGSGKGAVTADEDGDGSGAVAVSDEALQLKRIAATQEKNRRNQRKYRERQKVLGYAPGLPSYCLNFHMCTQMRPCLFL